MIHRFFTSLTGRERLLVAAGIAFLVLSGLWAGIFSPLHKTKALLEKKISSREQTLQDMLTLAPQIPLPSKTKPVPVAVMGDKPLFSTLEELATTLRIKENIRQMRPDTSDTGDVQISLRMENLLFSQIRRYIGMVEETFSIKNMAMEQNKKHNGRLDLTMTIASGKHYDQN